MTEPPASASDLIGAAPARYLDLRGETCPTTSNETLRALGGMAVGEVLEVESDYYPARSTIPYHCEKHGYRYAFLEAAAESRSPSGRPVWRMRIQKR